MQKVTFNKKLFKKQAKAIGQDLLAIGFTVVGLAALGVLLITG